ncbi:MAG: serine/threonine protein kinase [Candidatus Hydrogenedentes bacterium]|nr:serine/threonine protein kinase [Candidatus Hydrogenedentota bacterium]
MEIDSTHITDPDGGTPPKPGEAIQPPTNVSSTIADADSMLNRRLGNFEIIEVLGRGGFGAVYKARDLKLARFVAIKFLHNPLDARRRTLFEREARALAALSKEAAIVEVYEWGELGSQSYIVLEFVETSAENLLKQHPNGLPVLKALGIVADCAAALSAAHKAGILHRDIKPANILLEADKGSAKLADFGLAHLSEEEGEFTLAGGLSGSPPYMSPEQASAGSVDSRSDIFSLGVTMYELLCGDRPFVGTTSGQIIEKIRRNDRIPLGERCPGLPGIVVDIVDKATAHDPGDRYPSAEEFLAELRTAIGALEGNEQIDTRSRRRVVRKGGSRRLLLAGCALALALILLLLSGQLVQRWNVTPEGAAIADPKQAYAQAREEVEAGDLDSALALFKALQQAGVTENRLLVDAYIDFIEEHKGVAPSEDTLEQAHRLGEKIRARESDPVKYDGWTSRPLSFFLLPREPEKSNYLEQNGVAQVFDQALDAAFRASSSIEYLDRKNIRALIAEQTLSADLSTESGRLQLGNFVGARLMVAGSFLQLTPQSKERFRLEVTDVETTKIIPAASLDVDTFLSVDDLLLAAADSLVAALEHAYPAQGRIFRDKNTLVLNIGQDVGLQQGQRFDVRPDVEGPPLEGVVVVVNGSPGPSRTMVTIEGADLESVPANADDAWYVRRLQESEVQ